jgi:predicted ATPase
MLSKVRKLPTETQTVVQVASCLGNTFDLETLSLVSGKSPEELERSLNVAISLGLIMVAQDTRIDPSSQEAKGHSTYKYSPPLIFRFISFLLLFFLKKSGL